MSRTTHPQGQPISARPVLANAIAGMREAAEAQHHTLQEARLRPFVLDDATVRHVLCVFRTQANDLRRYEEQLARW